MRGGPDPLVLRFQMELIYAAAKRPPTAAMPGDAS